MKKTLSDYPREWPEIAETIKQRDGYTCQNCGQVFMVGGAKLKAKFVQRAGRTRMVRLTLTVHHLDRDPMNCDPENLVSLCSACHCRAEWPLIRSEMAEKRTAAQVAVGQQTMFRFGYRTVTEYLQRMEANQNEL